MFLVIVAEGAGCLYLVADSEFFHCYYCCSSQVQSGLLNFSRIVSDSVGPQHQVLTPVGEGSWVEQL
jgi:hypothetical protein